MVRINNNYSEGDESIGLVPPHVIESEEVRYFAGLSRTGVKLHDLGGYKGPMLYDETPEGQNEIANVRRFSLDCFRLEDSEWQVKRDF